MGSDFYEGSRLINEHDIDDSIYSKGNPPNVTSDARLHFSVTESNGLRIYIGDKIPDSDIPSGGGGSSGGGNISGGTLDSSYENGNVIIKVGG